MEIKRNIKVFAIIMAILAIISLISCDSSTEKEKEQITEQKTGATDEELKYAANRLWIVESDVTYIASQQLDGWTTYSDIMEYYFTSKTYDGDVISIKTRSMLIHDKRKSARECLKEAKDIITKGGEGDFYNSVKEYYFAVDKYLTLVSKFPEGYSKITYSTTTSNYKAECQSAYSRLSLYLD